MPRVTARRIASRVTISGGSGTDVSPPLYTRVVRTSAELLAALASPDDFFIAAGAYSIDLGAITISTTPKHIQGAGMEEVTITLSTTTGFDFSPAQTSTGGVTMADVSIVVGVAFTFSVLEGLWAGSRIRIDSANLAIWSFNACNHLTDCVSLNASDNPASAGFFACNDLENCRAVDCAALGFSACTNVSGCRAELGVATQATANNGQFHTCVAVSGCVVFITGTTAVVHWAFTLCERVSGCWAELPATADQFKGYDRCEEVAGCRVDRGHSGFDACIQVSGCSVANAQVGPGFEECSQVSACFAETGAATGFLNCQQVSASRANANTSHGFSGGQNIVGSESTGSTAGWGFATAAGVIDGLSTCAASGNSLGAEDATATRKSNNTFV